MLAARPTRTTIMTTITTITAALLATAIATPSAHANKSSGLSATQKKALSEVYMVVQRLEYVKLKLYYSKSKTARNKALAKTCMPAVAAALSAGVGADQEIRIYNHHMLKPEERHVTRVGSVYFSTLNKVRALCLKYTSGSAANGARDALNPALRRLKQARKFAKLDTLDDTQVAVLDTPIKKCISEVNKALAAKVAPSTSIKLYDGSTVTLGTANAKVCLALKQLHKKLNDSYQAAIKAALEAKLKPFRKVLRGDKMKVFKRQEMYELFVYGRGKRRLRSPRDFRRASKWFQVMTYTNGCALRQCWTLRRFKFRGNRLKGTKESTGVGSSPPTRLFR